MDVGDLQLRFGRLRHVGEEDFEIVVLLLGLCQSRGATFRVPGIADSQFGASDVLRIWVRVNQSLQSEPRHVEAVMPHGVHSFVEQNFVRLLRSDVGQRVY